MQKHNIPFHEKHKGQLFCDRSAEDLIQMLLAECNGSASGGSVTRWQPCSLKDIRYSDAAPEAQRYEVDTSQGTVQAAAVVVATGAYPSQKLALPTLVTDWPSNSTCVWSNLDLVLCRSPLTTKRGGPTPSSPACHCPCALKLAPRKPCKVLTKICCSPTALVSPGVLQISSYWQVGTDIRINLAPEVDLTDALMAAKQESKKLIANELNAWVPSRLADTWVSQDPAWQRPVIEASDKALNLLAQRLSAWPLTPTGTEGYKRPRSPWAAWIRAICPNKPWNPSSQAYISSVKWWTSQVGWVATTSSGHGPAHMPAQKPWARV